MWHRRQVSGHLGNPGCLGAFRPRGCGLYCRRNMRDCRHFRLHLNSVIRGVCLLRIGVVTTINHSASGGIKFSKIVPSSIGEESRGLSENVRETGSRLLLLKTTCSLKDGTKIEKLNQSSLALVPLQSLVPGESPTRCEFRPWLGSASIALQAVFSPVARA